MRKVCLLVVLLAAGCGSVPPKTDDAALVTADAKVLEGCYDCLREARDIYARVAAGPQRTAVVRRLFETELLLTLREKALALDSTASFARAQALAQELPATVEAPRLLRIVDDVPPNEVGTPARTFTAFGAAHRADEKLIDDDVTWLATGPLRAPVRDVISRAIDCGYWPRVHSPAVLAALPRGAQPDAPRQRALPTDAPPIVRFAAATCMGVDAKALEALQQDVPTLVEAALFRGKSAAGRVQDVGPTESRALLTEAYRRFPNSPAVTYLFGNVSQAAGDCTTALRYFDETIALSPDHENAWLGRTTCLSVLERHDEALAAATHMIDGKILLRDGYYWRAWNYRELKQYDKARADIEPAKLLGFTVDVYRLAGMIEHDQDDLGPAETDLLAVRLSSAGHYDCVARWYLGLVYIKAKRFGESGQQFADAMDCYETVAAVSEGKLKAWETRTDIQIDPEFRASQIKAFQVVIQQDRSQQYASAFNAANYFAQSGDVPKARVFLELAAKDPALADLVQKLRDIIKGP